MAQFALLLPHTPGRYDGLDQDAYMAIIKDYIAWVEKLTAAGVYQGGHKLVSEPGRVLAARNGAVEVHDSPLAEVTEILGGIMLIAADDYDQAVEIARSHPHLKHNDRIEIRKVDGV